MTEKVDEEEGLLFQKELATERPLVRDRRAAEDSKITKMKKYTKLVLAIVAIISFFCFMLYKYRYDRLYNVMQVLEVFGTPDDPSLKPCPVPTSPGRVEIPAAWQTVNSSLHLYSAHCDSSPQPGSSPASSCSKILVISLSDKQPKLQCKLWFEGASKAMEGIFTAAKQSVTSDDGEEVKKELSLFFLFCESKFPEKTPYTVTFYTSAGAENHVPVNVLPKVTKKHFLQVCLLPPTTPAISPLLTESILLHTFLGVRSIQVYTPSLPPSTLSSLSSLQSSSSLHISPWLPPSPLSSSLTQQIVATDCYHRSRFSHSAWIVLTSDQVLMPRTAQSLTEAEMQLIQGKVLSQGPNSVTVKRFCSEYPTEKQAKGFNTSLKVFESTFYNQQLSKDDTVNLNWLETSGGGEASLQLAEVLSVNEYGACDRHDFSSTDKEARYEGDALRFSKDFLQYYNKHI